MWNAKDIRTLYDFLYLKKYTHKDLAEQTTAFENLIEKLFQNALIGVRRDYTLICDGFKTEDSRIEKAECEWLDSNLVTYLDDLGYQHMISRDHAENGFFSAATISANPNHLNVIYQSVFDAEHILDISLLAWKHPYIEEIRRDYEFMDRDKRKFLDKLYSMPYHNPLKDIDFWHLLILKNLDENGKFLTEDGVVCTKYIPMCDVMPNDIISQLREEGYTVTGIN